MSDDLGVRLAQLAEDATEGSSGDHLAVQRKARARRATRSTAAVLLLAALAAGGGGLVLALQGAGSAAGGRDRAATTGSLGSIAADELEQMRPGARPASDRVAVVAEAAVAGKVVRLAVYKNTRGGQCLALVYPGHPYYECSNGPTIFVRREPIYVTGWHKEPTDIPDIAFGYAPAGTKQLRFRMAGGKTATTQAYETDAYRGKAFFIASFSLFAGPGQLDAVDKDGRVIATVPAGSTLPPSTKIVR